MQKDVENSFKNLCKGTINILDENTIEWILGDMIVLFGYDIREITVEIC